MVAYRKVLLKSWANFLFRGLWPLTRALFMFWILFESMGELDSTAIGIGLGALALGLVPMVRYRRSTYHRPHRLDAATTEQVAREYEREEPVFTSSAGDTVAADF